MPTFLSVFLLVSLFWFPAQAQLNSATPTDRPIFSKVEEPPQFPGGMDKFTDYLKKNLHYPKAARKAKLEGSIVVNFVVTEDGRITDVKLYNSLGLGTDEEALRLIENMPNWTPGKQAGKAVNVRYNLPINFRLNT
ncbi:energy transducer TonB [Spirosoma sp. KNUC1025]|uniref:energy transducer TonB n=1 Tax=Spirosoma sp. KNUC1025 TaxID=2894082 RepID=UPI00386487C4|nr:energy transducer TonB [Spirosoma sp. KNUC1025]